MNKETRIMAITIKFSTKDKNKFKKLGISAIYLFGSASQGFSGKLSDIDIGVVFSNPKKIKNTLEPYKELYKLFSQILPIEKEIDLVFLQFASLAVQFDAVSKGRVIYKNSEQAPLDYKERVMKETADFEYFYNLSKEGLFQRI